MNNKKRHPWRIAFITGIALSVVACSDNDSLQTTPATSASGSTQDTVSYDPNEVYAGGRLGTAFNASKSAFEQPAPAVEEQGFDHSFQMGEYQFERDYNQNRTGAFIGLGPVMVHEMIHYYLYYTGEDVNYIESPHAYNSIQDFYDNIRGCKQALYGGLGQVNATTPAQNSLMAYCLTAYPTEARAAMAAMETALTAINQMKRPFVLNYTDPSAGKAIDALHSLDDALGALKQKLDPNAETE